MIHLVFHDQQSDHVLPLSGLRHYTISNPAHRSTGRPTMYHVRLQDLHDQQSQVFLVLPFIQAPSFPIRRRIFIESFRYSKPSFLYPDSHFSEPSVDFDELHSL